MGLRFLVATQIGWTTGKGRSGGIIISSLLTKEKKNTHRQGFFISSDRILISS